MKKYEIVFILQADEPSSEMDARVAKVESILAEHGGEVTERNHWGVRQLAYEIQHETRGNYMHLLFKAEGSAIDVMDNEFRLDHKVLRHLIVLDEEWQARNAANRARRPDLTPLTVPTTPSPVEAAETPEPTAESAPEPAAAEDVPGDGEETPETTEE